MSDLHLVPAIRTTPLFGEASTIKSSKPCYKNNPIVFSQVCIMTPWHSSSNSNADIQELHIVAGKCLATAHIWPDTRSRVNIDGPNKHKLSQHPPTPIPLYSYSTIFFYKIVKYCQLLIFIALTFLFILSCLNVPLP